MRPALYVMFIELCFGKGYQNIYSFKQALQCVMIQFKLQVHAFVQLLKIMK